MPSTNKMTRRKIREMARRGKLIDKCFKVFAAVVYPGAGADQLRELRVSFFAGAAELFALINAGLDDGVSETDGDLAFMEQLGDELDAFFTATRSPLSDQSS